ncbi:hypothetical protein N2152v2_008453 [Parachlorella kessleri]
MNDRGDDAQYRAPRASLSLADFELLKRIGDGSYSQVVLARHRASGKEYALKEVFKSAANNGKPLDQKIYLHLEALEACEEAQASLAALTAAGRRTDDSGAALSLSVVAASVETAAAQLAQKEPRRAVADRLHAGALARVCLDGTVSGEAVRMMVYAVELISGDTKRKLLE